MNARIIERQSGSKWEAAVKLEELKNGDVFRAQDKPEELWKANGDPVKVNGIWHIGADPINADGSRKETKESFTPMAGEGTV